MTRALADLLGFCCYEEALSRVSSCRMAIPTTELELLGIMLYQVQMVLQGGTSCSYYMRVLRNNGNAVLVRVDTRRPTGSASGIARIGEFTPVTVAEFDEQLARNPAMVRPYMHAIGDCRRGQELLDSAREEIGCCNTLAHMMQTPEGLRLLNNFARVMAGMGQTIDSMLTCP